MIGIREYLERDRGGEKRERERERGGAPSTAFIAEKVASFAIEKSRIAQ